MAQDRPWPAYQPVFEAQLEMVTAVLRIEEEVVQFDEARRDLLKEIPVLKALGDFGRVRSNQNRIFVPICTTRGGLTPPAHKPNVGLETSVLTTFVPPNAEGTKTCQFQRLNASTRNWIATFSVIRVSLLRTTS